jgi:cell division septum initiation protein DivIVA
MFRRAEVVPAGEPVEGEPIEASLSTPPPHLTGALDAMLSVRPCFRGQLRGYDRMQVDNYVAWAETEMQAMRRQSDLLLGRCGAAQAELEISRRLLSQSPRGRELSSASDRVGEMLRLAADEASSMTAAGADEAARILAEARLEADARLRKAHEIKQAAMAASDQIREQTRREREEATGIIERARRQAQELLHDAATERDRLAAEAADARARLAAVQAEVDDLRRQRDEARQLLRRLTDQMGQALEAVSAVVPDERVLAGERVLFNGNVAQLT